jgi:hypothetical protein
MSSAKCPQFREELLTVIHQLIDLPISHGLVTRMTTLERLLVHFEAREFAYSSAQGVTRWLHAIRVILHAVEPHPVVS